MSKKPSTNGSSNKLSFYHQNEALLFQFMLHESLRIHQTLKSKAELEVLDQVIGDVKVTKRSWHAPYGHLPKLFHYYSLMLTHYNDPPTNLCEHMGHTLERACLAAKECHAQISKKKADPSKLYTQLRKEVRTLVKLLFDKLPDYRENPSVLYFLLQHHKKIDALFRKPMIKNTFCSFFPKGSNQAKNFLIEKFSKKGFNHLIPSIEESLATLKMDES